MKWKKEDLEQYKKAKEYIDTAIIPLIPFQLDNDNELDKHAFQAEVLTIFSHEIEKELMGRVMLFPGYYYLQTAKKDKELERINEWIGAIRKQPFEHILFLTFDSSWKKYDQAVEGDVLWYPAMQSGHLHSKETKSFIRDQVSQIIDLIRSYWH